LAKLRCESGESFYFHRLGSLGSGPDSHNVDGYELLCRKGKHGAKLYFDFYHEGASSRLPEGLTQGPGEGAGVPFYVENFPDGLSEELNDENLSESVEL
jgi:hypothetical protein